MFLTLVISLLTWLPAETGGLADASRAVAKQSSGQQGTEYDRRRQAAGDDVKKLWELYQWCVQQKLEKEGRSTLRQILKLSPDHKEANEALGHVFFDGKWFASQNEVEQYKKEKEEKEAKEKGLVKYEDRWVPVQDIAYLRKGFTKNEKGEWVDVEAEKKLREGWVRQDLEWISPDEKPHVEKGEWKCGEEWLNLEAANRYHSDPQHWWRIPTAHLTLLTTCDREVAVDRICKQLEPAWDDLVRIYGRAPSQPVTVLILRDQPQYEQYAAGDQASNVPPTESNGLSSIHYAYFADLGVDRGKGEIVPMGVSYWDASTDAGNRWGVHSARHALGQSFADASDPSPWAMERMTETGEPDPQAFWAEKRVPAWFRWGASAYAERYFIDTLVGAGGNNRWAREWSVSNIVGRGGLRPLKEIFKCEISFEGGADAQKLINEEGLVIAFVMDGGCKPVTEKHKALVDALRDGKDAAAIAAASADLQAEVEKHEAELRKFAGI